MKPTEPKTKVIFRIWPKSKGGEVIALFPALAGTNQAHTCLSYQHIGQHGSADMAALSRAIPLASREQYRDLLQELRRMGYNLQIAKRATAADKRNRIRQIA